MTDAPRHLASTPCVQICVIDPHSALCVGCGRTVSEIAAWSGLDELSRLSIMAGLDARLAVARSRGARRRGPEAREGS
jgi:predicted Fe-S protein YdhL (DUF1289 family)